MFASLLLYAATRSVRLHDFPVSKTYQESPSSSSLTADENQVLDDLERRAIRFFWEQSNPKTGFTKDRANNFGVDDHTISSCAATGFALAAYPIGVEHKWLDRANARERTKITLAHLLSTHQSKNGWFYHFVDWNSGERQWKCEASTIDTSILLAGVWMARQYWHDDEITRDADAITRRIDWKWMMRTTEGDPQSQFINMGWHPEDENGPHHGFIGSTWSSYCELLMLYIQAYGASNVREGGWDSINRTIAQYDGHPYLAGGPLFIHQMTNGFYSLNDLRDRGGYSYWFSTRQSTLANRAYCIANANKFKGFGDGFWGLTACDMPDGYGVAGIPPDPGDQNGTIAPTCAIASLPYTPRESMDAATAMMKNYKYAYGIYGFSNGINPSHNWKGPDVLGIDLGMMLLGIEDYRTGLPWKLSASHPMVKKGYERAGLHVVPGSNDGPLVSP